MPLPQLRHKGALAWELQAGRNQYHQDLPRMPSRADEHMTQEPPSRVFIIYPQLEGREQLHNGLDDAAGALILNQAPLHRDNPVGARRIDARKRQSPLVHPKGRMHLVAIVKGIRHAQYGFHRTVGRKQLFHQRLFMRQLLAVGHAGQLAAAAAGSHRAIQPLLPSRCGSGRGSTFRHGILLRCASRQSACCVLS